MELIGQAYMAKGPWFCVKWIEAEMWRIEGNTLGPGQWILANHSQSWCAQRPGPTKERVYLLVDNNGGPPGAWSMDGWIRRLPGHES